LTHLKPTPYCTAKQSGDDASKESFPVIAYLFFVMTLQPYSDLDRLTVEDSSSHAIRYTQSVGFL